MGYNEFAASTRTRAFSIGTHSIAANSVVTVVTGGPESGPEPPIPSPEEATLTLTPPPMARVR